VNHNAAYYGRNFKFSKGAEVAQVLGFGNSSVVLGHSLAEWECMSVASVRHLSKLKVISNCSAKCVGVRKLVSLERLNLCIVARQMAHRRFLHG
jgi:hypothetical protein